jgi:hypothetical protein
MNKLQTAYDIIDECGERAENYEQWAATDLQEFVNLLADTHVTSWMMLQTMICGFRDRIEGIDDLLKDYDPVTGLDEYGESNKADLLEKQHCEETLQSLQQIVTQFEEWNI